MSVYKVTTLVCFVTLLKLSQEKCLDEEKVCEQTKIHGMVSADCYSKNIRKIPQCLRSDVEIIDLSFNRIRKITKEEMANYKSIKMLYLSDNLLTNLDNSAFEDLTNLVSLDLSLNAIVQLPPSILGLPSLKRLYLSQNHNINIVEAIEQAKPITGPLELLDISFNELETLPSLGILPHLLLYNVSGNHVVDMKIRDIAGACNLKKFVNMNFSAYFHDPCDCWSLQHWLRERGVTFTKIPCDIKQEGCPYSISEEDLQIFNHCKSRVAEIDKKTFLFKVGIGAAAVIGVLLLIIVGCVVYRKRKNRRLLKEKRLNNLLNGKKEGAGLL